MNFPESEGCRAWRMKVILLLKEREQLRAALKHAQWALRLMESNDSSWFPGTTAVNHIKKLEDA